MSQKSIQKKQFDMIYKEISGMDGTLKISIIS